MVAITGVDVRNLAEAGWGVIFPQGGDPTRREALRPLLELRRTEALGLFSEFTHLPGESALKFLARHGAGVGPVDPDRLPYYLLLVGSPEEISFNFQYALDVQYAVGRLHFDTPEEYACYALSVVEAEFHPPGRSRRATFVGVSNPDDPATARSRRRLVEPLVRKLDELINGSWSMECLLGEAASKKELLNRLEGEQQAFLFFAGHGLGFEPDDPCQLSRQGALLCQDWPGPKVWAEQLSEEFYIAADDVSDNCRIHGLLVFLFACYSAGCPEYDSFPFANGGSCLEPGEYFFGRKKSHLRIASKNFIAKLPRRLLGHPGGSALAVVGQVDRNWSYSFDWPLAGEQSQTFTHAIRQMLDGCPVGAAMEGFGQRYAEIACHLNHDMERAEGVEDGGLDLFSMRGLLTAHHDARSYIILGDPAVRVL